jgi:hypothetical protein
LPANFPKVDSSGAGYLFNGPHLLEAILDLSSQILDQYQDTEIETIREEFYVGRLEGEEDGFVWLRTLPPQSELEKMLPEEIAELRPHSLSHMPEGLLDTYTEEEVLDLLAALVAGPAQ